MKRMLAFQGNLDKGSPFFVSKYEVSLACNARAIFSVYFISKQFAFAFISE
jgi:hypothetical protein